MTMNTPITIAIYQDTGVRSDVPANLSSMAKTARQAANLRCKLAIFPELYLTGYNIGDALPRLAQPWDGPAAQEISRIALENKIAILYGYPEREEGKIFNSALYIDSQGEARANYRKTHLYGPEMQQFTPGRELMITRLGELNLGILICYDVEFHGAVAALARAGADLIAVPTAAMHPFSHLATTVVPTRAYENQVYLAYANRCGKEDNLHYIGSSCVVGPDGLDLVRANETTPELITAEIDLDFISRFREAEPLLEDRRPALYRQPVIRTE